MRVVKPFAQILFKKKGSSVYEEVDWTTWSLKKSLNELHQLDATLLSPSDWVDFESETGCRMNVGDELYFYGKYSDDTSRDSLKFGGVFDGLTGSWDGQASYNVTGVDFRQLYKNRQIFKDYYKLLPINIGQYSNLVGKLSSLSTLYDIVKDVSSIVGLTDFSKLDSPYLSKTTGTTIPISVGTGSSGTQRNLGASRNCMYLRPNGSDAEYCYTLYSDATGYDAVEYPNFSMVYHHHPSQRCLFGFRVTINGVQYYIPWSSSLSGYTGYFLDPVSFKTTGTFSTVNVDIAGLMDLKYPDISYPITKIELVHKGGFSGSGTLYIDSYGPTDPNQTTTITQDYTFTDALDILNTVTSAKNYLFNVTPNKQPYITSYNSLLTDKKLVEGDNVLSAEITVDPSNLVNNFIVISKLDEPKALIGQSIMQDSIDLHGMFDSVEENNDVKTNSAVKSYVDTKLKNYGYLTPSVKVSAVPSFDYSEGQIIYTYLPSLGIDKSMQIQSVTWSYDGSMELELGMPTDILPSKLSEVDKGQKLGLRRGASSLDAVSSAKREQQFSKPYLNPEGKIAFSGEELVEAGVDLNNDVDSEGVPLWMDPDMQGKVRLDPDGVYIDWTGTKNGDYVLLPLGVPANHEKFGSVVQATLNYTTSTNLDSKIGIESYWYSTWDKATMYDEYMYYLYYLEEELPLTSHLVNIVPFETKMPVLNYYHTMLKISNSKKYANKYTLNQSNGGEDGTTTGVGAKGGTVSSSITVAKSGTHSWKIVPGGSTNDNHMYPEGDTGGMRCGMVAGNSYTAYGKIYVPSATGLSPDNIRGLRIVAFYKDSGGTYQEVMSDAPTITDNWVSLSVSFSIPVGATEAFIRYYNGFLSTSKVVYWDELMLSDGLTVQPLWVPGGSEGDDLINTSTGSMKVKDMTIRFRSNS